MRRSKSTIALASLVAILCFSNLAVTGCGIKKGAGAAPATTHTKSVDCVNTINVSPTTGVIGIHTAVYVCDGDTLTWTADPANTFIINFPNECPLTPATDCTNLKSQILSNQSVASSKIDAQPTNHIQLYKYSITVNNGKPFDPHVVGGGGH